MKRALVTGHLGFIGRNLKAQLETLGSHVEGIAEDIFDREDWDSHLLSIVENFAPEAVFHVGACSNTLEQRSQYIMERNFQSTKVLMDWAAENSVPFIYSSSAANYGTNGRYPSNLYGWSKYVAEGYVSAVGGVSLRYFNVYGPGEEDKSNMASFFFQALEMRKSGIQPKLFPGKPLRDFVYIKDVVAANLAAFQNFDAAKGGVFDVGTTTPRLFEDALNILGIGYSYTEASAKPKGYQEFTCADAAKRLPGWLPEYSLESGLADYLRTLSFE
jgi:ADP-L-glycero-D-manno-heptose 6-epimerase